MRAIADNPQRAIAVPAEHAETGRIAVTLEPNIDTNVDKVFALKDVAEAKIARDEALAKEHEASEILMALQAWQGFANFTAQVAGPLIASPQAR